MAASWICSAQKGQARTAVRLALIALARAEPPFAQEDRDEQRGDPEEFAEASAIDCGPDHGEEQEKREDRSGGRHEKRAHAQRVPIQPRKDAGMSSAAGTHMNGGRSASESAAPAAT